MKKFILICWILGACLLSTGCDSSPKDVKTLDIVGYENDVTFKNYYYATSYDGELKDDNGLTITCSINIVPLEEEKFDKPIPYNKKDWKLMHITYFLENNNRDDMLANVNFKLRIGDEDIVVPDTSIEELGYKYADIETSLPVKFTIEADDFQDVNEHFLIDYDKYKGKQGVAELTVNNKIYVYNFNMDDNVAELRY